MSSVKVKYYQSTFLSITAHLQWYNILSDFSFFDMTVKLILIQDKLRKKKALMIAQKVFEQPDAIQFWRF